MLKIYKSNENAIVEIEHIENGCWINLVNPTKTEIDIVENALEIPREFITAALDTNEKARIELEDEAKLIIIDIPTIDTEMPEYEAYSTLPLSIILADKAIITVCTHNTTIISDIADGKIKGLQTSFRNRFILRILMRAAQRFLLYLAKIEQIAYVIEKQLNDRVKNSELLQLLALSKSLIYFKASLKSNEAILRKMLRGHILKLYEEDEDLLEDALIEMTQGTDMASSYAEVLKATMETYSSVASNNLNAIMKVLATITILMSVPQIVFGFYGMNILSIPFSDFYWFPILASLLGGAIIGIFIKLAKF